MKHSKSGSLTEYEAKMILAFANHDMRPAVTSRFLYMSRGNLEYHFLKIMGKTGKNPRNFYDLCHLVPKAKEILSNEQEV